MRKLIVITLTGLFLMFSNTAFGQTTTTQRKSVSKTARKSKTKPYHGGHQDGTGIRRKNPKSFHGGQQDGTGIRRKNPTQVTGGTIPVYKNGKSSTKRKRTPVKNSFESQTQPFADGKVKGKNDPEAKPALLEFQIPEKVVSDNKHPEGQYSRKEADSRKSNQKPKRTNVKKSNGIIILDQDTQTVVAPRKRRRNK